ncbi:hypothetical protein RIF29_39891 [Crotalaria pallida]|uniref:Uncharacterized protein n=1 Tax=Crotalaria pallida TaxID=3830 RepID=A0AAN9E2M7_CROPI
MFGLTTDCRAFKAYANISANEAKEAFFFGWNSNYNCFSVVRQRQEERVGRLRSLSLKFIFGTVNSERERERERSSASSSTSTTLSFHLISTFKEKRI